MGARITGGAAGLATGIVGGLVWTAVESLLGWWSGSVVPAAILRTIAIANVAVAGTAGLLVGLVAPAAGRRVTAFVLVGAYGLMRVWAPPGLGAELGYVVTFGLLAAIALRVAGTSGGWADMLLTVALGAAGVLLGDAWLDEHWDAALHGKLLPFAVAGIAFAPLVAEWLVSLVLRSAPVRASVVAAAGLTALLATATPLSTAPLVEDVVTGVPP